MYLEEKHFGIPEDVLIELFKHIAAAGGVEILPLESLNGRVLAADLYAKHTLPLVRSAGVDGIAVRWTDFKNGLPDSSAWVKGEHYVMADTGDDFADRFDTVIRIESVVFNENGGFSLEPGLNVQPGQLVGASGGTVREGERLLCRGTRLTPMQIGMIATGGYAHAPVYRKPVVAYIPTGSELVEPGVEIRRGQNVQSNGVMLRAMLAEWNADFLQYPIIRDERAAIETAFEDALQRADIVMMSGGSSKGSEDFTARVMMRRSSYFQHGLQHVPGRPAGVGAVDGKPVITLPGPPYGAYVVMQ